MYRLADRDSAYVEEVGASTPVFLTLRCYLTLIFCKQQKTTVQCPAMSTGRKRGGFGTPPEYLPHRSDRFCCSDWTSAGEFLKESGLPEERFEWSMEINQDTGEWLIHGEAHTKLTDKLIARWSWLRVRLRPLWRRIGRFGW